MLSTLTDDDVRGYRENGFLRMPALLDASELERWRRVTDAAVAARVGATDALSNAGADSYYTNVFTQASGLRRISHEMASMVLDENLGAMAARLAGADCMRLWNEQALVKRPYANATAWHLDLPYWSFDDRRALTVWIALDDATIENGCMWYLPGTHATARLDAVELDSNLLGIIGKYPDWSAVKSVPAPVPAGGAIWHNGLIAHGAGANMTNGFRRAMTIAFMPDGVRYNGKRDAFVFSEEQAEAMQPGDLLDDDEINPVVWAGPKIAVA